MNSTTATIGNGWWNTTTVALVWFTLPVTLRSAPNVAFNGGTIATEIPGSATAYTYSSTIPYSVVGTGAGWVGLTNSGATFTTGNPVGLRLTGGATGVLTLSAEL
jgi:hypothetical protein